MEGKELPALGLVFLVNDRKLLEQKRNGVRYENRTDAGRALGGPDVGAAFGIQRQKKASRRIATKW